MQKSASFEQINCVVCHNPVNLIKKGYSIKSSVWDGTVDLIFSPLCSSLLAIGVCTNCTKKSMESGTLIKVEV